MMIEGAFYLRIEFLYIDILSGICCCSGDLSPSGCGCDARELLGDDLLPRQPPRRSRVEGEQGPDSLPSAPDDVVVPVLGACVDAMEDERHQSIAVRRKTIYELGVC